MTQTRRGFFSSLAGLVAAPAVAVAPPEAVAPTEDTFTRRYVLDKRFGLPIILTVKDKDWEAIKSGNHVRYDSLDHMSGSLAALPCPTEDSLAEMRRSQRRHLRRQFQAVT